MIDFEALQKLRVQDGDLLVVPVSTEQDDMQLLAEAIQLMNGARAVIVRGPIKQLDSAAMNKLGWYRA
jgi:CxxC motif-containing protein